jgi:hypothetical protein
MPLFFVLIVAVSVCSSFLLHGADCNPINVISKRRIGPGGDDLTPHELRLQCCQRRFTSCCSVQALNTTLQEQVDTCVADLDRAVSYTLRSKNCSKHYTMTERKTARDHYSFNIREIHGKMITEVLPNLKAYNTCISAMPDPKLIKPYKIITELEKWNQQLRTKHKCAFKLKNGEYKAPTAPTINVHETIPTASCDRIWSRYLKQFIHYQVYMDAFKQIGRPPHKCFRGCIAQPTLECVLPLLP